MKTRSGLLVIVLLAAGCGGDDKAEPEPVSGPAKEVATVIEKLERATARKDFATICNELLAQATRKQAGGDECPAVLEQRARGVARPKIVIKSIEVKGDRAQVRVETIAKGQATVTDLLHLVREGGRFRVLSLGR